MKNVLPLTLILFVGFLPVGFLGFKRKPQPAPVPASYTNAAGTVFKYQVRPPPPPPIPGMTMTALSAPPPPAQIALRIVNRSNDVLLSWPTNKPTMILEAGNLSTWNKLDYGTFCRFDSQGVWYCEHAVVRPKNLAAEFYRLRQPAN